MTTMGHHETCGICHTAHCHHVMDGMLRMAQERMDGRTRYRHTTTGEVVEIVSVTMNISSGNHVVVYEDERGQIWVRDLTPFSVHFEETR